MNPSSWSDSVGLVLELAWVKGIELTENSVLEELRVKSSDTVDSVRADNGKIGHSNLLWESLLDQGHSADLFSISWVLLLQLGKVDVVDQVDEFQVSWQ